MGEDVKSRLRALIDEFLSGGLPFEAFQEAYSKRFIDEADAVLSPTDLEYYGDIHERAEWTARNPPPQDRSYGWMSIGDFTRWLSDVRKVAP